MTAPLPPGEPFPFTYTAEANLPAYLRVRAEGMPLRQAIWSGLSYLRKYRRAKYSAPPEAIAYFDAQRELVRWLGAEADEGTRLAAVGDIMWLRDGWSDFLSPDVLAYLNGHEVVLGNLESPISRRCSVPRLLPDYFTFNSHPGLITSFRRPDGASTFSALMTCNNHSLDRGDEGLGDTLAFLGEQHIPHAGVRASADEKSYITFQRDGLTIGYYAACWGMNNPEEVNSSRYHIEVLPGLVPQIKLPVNISRVRDALRGMAADGVDFRVVSLHWGHEFEFYPTPELMQVGRDIIRAGADLLLGTHPHVVQPLEVCFVNGYERRLGEDAPALACQERTGCLLRDESGIPRKGLIAYSLGNFATAMFTLHCRTGVILSLRLKRDAETGRVDWHRPETQLVYNVHRDPRTRRRRLMLLESYLRDCERHGDSATRVREFAAFLERHLLGQSSAESFRMAR